ncbi:hypothetical protein O1M54_41955 [Streptomyces diastatochromogenes]|nr:hypothetical protein [Streptomyces diastatochromogenes]
MSALTEAVRAGRTAETLRLVKGMTATERRTSLPELKELRKELRAVPPWEDRSERVRPALHLAGAACHTGAAAAAAWLAASDLRGDRHPRSHSFGCWRTGTRAGWPMWRTGWPSDRCRRRCRTT